MTGRSRQIRRTPHSSSGNVSLSTLPPEAHHVPRVQGINEHSNPSLPNLASAAGVSAQERIVKGLVDKVIVKMPSYSGLGLSALEVDESLLQVHEALCQLSRHCANIIVWSLCEVLDKLQKKHVGSDTRLDILESEIYIIRVLALILNFRTNAFATGDHGTAAESTLSSTPPTLQPRYTHSTQRSTSVSTLTDSIALEDNVAKYALVVMLGFIRRSGPTKSDALKASGKLDTLNVLRDFYSYERDAALLHVKRTLPYRFGVDSDTTSTKDSVSMSHHTNRSVSTLDSGSGTISTVAAYIPSASAVRLSTFANDAPMMMTHLAGRVIYYLSASNWPMVFSRIRNKIHYFAANMIDEGQDIVDIRLVTYSAIDKNRLVQVLQELSSLLVNMRPDAQGSVAVALRTVVWNWIEDFTDEFIQVVQTSRRQLDGQPERVFDLLHQLVDTNNRRMFWPTLSVLVATSPERLKAAEAALNGTLKFGKKHNNFLEQLHWALTTQSKLGEVAVMCYNDICHAAFHLPPHAENSILRSLAPDLADELKSRLMNPPPPVRPFYDSLEPIDVNLYADALVVILRYHPMMALVGVLPACLEMDRSAAVKLCVVRALTILVTEAPRFPWQPALDKSIYSFVAPKLRAAMMDLHNRPGAHSTTRPLSARDGPPTQPNDDRRELLLSLQALWRLDFGFFFAEMKEDDYLPFIECSLKVLHPPKDESIQTSTLRTLGAILAKLNDPQDEHSDAVKEFMYHSGAITLHSGALELLRVTDDLEENNGCMNMILAVLLQLADRSLEGRQAWKFNPKRLTALAVVETALLVSLTSPRLEICSLAARGLRLMTLGEQDPDAPPPEQYTHEQTSLRTPLLEAIGDPTTIVLGRVEFQKRMRGVISPGAFPCITHLATWKECYYRWSMLKPIVTANGSRSSTEMLLNGSTSKAPTPEEMQMEWENLTLLLASAAASCLSDEHAFDTPTEYRLPYRKNISDQRPSELTKQFINELVSLLVNPWPTARTIARDALGIELTPKMFSTLFEHLDELIGETFAADDDLSEGREQLVTLFVDQVISIYKLIMDRLGDTEALLIKVDIGENLLVLGRFIHRGQPNASELRIKARFCALIDILLEKREILRIRQESMVRNQLLDILADWILECPTEWPEDDIARREQLRAQRDSNLAALKTCVNLLENLHLQASDGYDGSTGSETAHVISRLFHRYFTILIMALTPRNKEVMVHLNTLQLEVLMFATQWLQAESMMEFDQVSQQSALGGKNDAQVQELVVTGIASMLHANTDAGTKHVLSLGYNDSSRLRAVFAHVFCRVLSRGTKFDQYTEGLAHISRKSRLCEMVKESEIIAQAIIDVCPMPEIDTIVPVLLNIYDTRRTLLNLLKMIIHRQVELTNSDVELFRSNDMCSRLMSAFAKLHGYNYLRSILSPLITLMLEIPVGRGYELDPTKLRPGETQGNNAETLKTIAKAFLRVISESVNAIPPIIREVCRYIEDAVTAVWPESRYAAVGAFIFLRFIVPAIVAPETVDIEIPRNDPRAAGMRRGLLLVAKIIQNLANNIMFGKEAHMTMLNPFLQDHILPVTRFQSDILKISPEQPVQNLEEWLGMSYDETDTIILHRFFQKHADKVGKVLLSLSRTTNSHESVSASGKKTWDNVCSLLVEMGAAMEPPTQSDKPSSQHHVFRMFMAKNGHRNMESVREIFQNTMTLQDQRPLFVLALSKIDVETIDLELLMCHIFKTIRDKTGFEQPFDVILDCTAFTSVSEVPISWCKLCMEHLPTDLRQNFETAYILNSNVTAQKFLRKLYHVCSDAKFANNVMALSSIAELAEHVHPASLTPMSYTTTAESENYTLFECYQYQRNQLRIAVIMQVGISHIRITSLKTQPIYPHLSCKTVDIIPLLDIGDVSIVWSRNETTDFIIRCINGTTISFSSLDREEICKIIRIAKSRLKSARPLIPSERSPRLADVSAALLNVGLLNVCDEDEYLRGAAYDLLFAVCSYVNYEANPLVPLRGPFIPSNTAAFILPFSERLASFVPQLTLDLIAEFSVGFEKASTAQKITCLQYLNPWIKNLVLFANPTSPQYEPTGAKLKDSIRSLIDITVKFPDVYPTLQRSVWTELGKHDSLLLHIALEELMRAAIDGGLGSRRCEQVADTLIAMSSINVRAKVLAKLRKVLAKASVKSTRSLTQCAAWNEISALSRLALVAGYSSRLAVQNQLFVPEIAHVTTMLCATGTLAMRTTIYGIAMNLVQSLHIARAEEEGPAADLKKLLDYASYADTLQQFGLVRTHPSSEYSSVESPADQISIAALESITELLIKALTHGAQSTGLLNVWRGRWMSLVTATAFQVCPYIQYRAFVVLGLLASSEASEVDDDLLYQMLVAFKNALATSTDNDSATVMSMLRCITRVIPGLGTQSRYLSQVFWLAVALLQSTYLPLYGEAARLLEVSLETMASRGMFKDHRMSEVLLHARDPSLSGITTQLDTIMGLSFDTGFSFSLASIVFRGVRLPALRPVARTLLTTVLRIAAKSCAAQMEIDSEAAPIPLDHDILGYFLALLPFASTSASYRDLLKDSRVGTRWWPPLSYEEDGEEDTAVPRVSVEIFGFAADDSRTPLLVISFLFAMLNSYQGTEQEKEFLFGLLAQLAGVYPDVCASAVVHYLVNPKSEWLMSNLTDTFVGSPETASAVQNLFRIAMTSPAWSAAASSTMGPQGEDTSGQRTPHYRALEELDMHSLSGTWQFLLKGDASKVLQWIPQLIDVIIDSEEPDELEEE